MAGVALGELLRKLDALHIAARGRGRALVQADVTHAHVEQRLQFAHNVGREATEREQLLVLGLSDKLASSESTDRPI